MSARVPGADAPDEATLDRLAERAVALLDRAYAPYSSFPVGVALLCADGTVVEGVNIENASYPVSHCAERTALGTAITAGHREFLAVAIASAAETPTPPCGFCRQALVEFAPSLTVLSVTRSGRRAVWRLDELLTHAFTPKSLGPNVGTK